METAVLAGERPAAPVLPLRARRRAWLARSVLFVAPVALLIVLLSAEVHADVQYRNDGSALESTRQEIAHTVTELDAVRRNLQTVDGQVDQTTTALTNDTNQLREVQAAVSNAHVSAVTQQSTISALHACLGGVEQSLNALAVGDTTSAGKALGVVAPDCARVLATGG